MDNIEYTNNTKHTYTIYTDEEIHEMSEDDLYPLMAYYYDEIKFINPYDKVFKIITAQYNMICEEIYARCRNS
jgi:hypothetical protein